jgi:hypothetical protein
MKIIKKSMWHQGETHMLHFHYRTDPGSGFSFPCNEKGEVDRGNMCGAALDNLDACLSGKHDVVPKGGERVTLDNSWREPSVGLCDCGEEVSLGGFTNTCEECGLEYNSAGQQLADRSQWGEETGESVADILAVDCGEDY